MLEGKKIVVIMPAYNAAKTLRQTVTELPNIVDQIIVVDDHSLDNTRKVAKSLGVQYIRHNKNKGYGGNQKTCYLTALKRGADVVIMVHPDYQYSPRLVTAMCAMLLSGHYDIVLASRIIGDQTTRIRSMPLWRYGANRFLTLVQNVLLNYKLSEYHTGYRGFTRKALKEIDFENNSDDFIFDNEILAQAIYQGLRIGEISCPTSYHNEASSINFSRACKYGIGVLIVVVTFRLNRLGLLKSRLFKHNSQHATSMKRAGK
ncbi:MAG: hypothetical protein US60_C0016G0002 [Microgenomates group bacterium GW2011_GWC1_37_8]|uniref:Glycosyltransferase 2-like domain-containing protein n=1 Tax=Candidatus Woesebacteria bacterium GW2011_GWB1_38_8 TaxID=1618570 RepID=A0A0G0LCN6_9BACT|nr:MAG: hypothetical protein US60_C0016G0002 [Microgenomates group bacterium GW2011_GWC1_37_8]KKQ85640.1 MAG: hypothetical protein UT08_C0005G0091 [Candidatus Woesebacteria bacterium GW2011_GWB1_38_8]